MAKFKKVLMVSLASVLAASSAVGLVACGDEGEGGTGGSGKYTSVTFWGGGDAYEVDVFDDLVNTFNATVGQEKKIKVNYSSGHDDYSTVEQRLTAGTAGDIVYVPDRQFKKWASTLLIYPLTDPKTGAPMFDGVEEFTNGSIWDWGINRYRMDFYTSNSTPTSTLWALPKDIGPSVLYYNREYMNYMGINHISVDIGTDEFKQKGYPEKGYFEMDGQWYFNNRVPMSWDEVTELGMRMQKECRDYSADNRCEYGYFTEWWFNYGYGVGGDVVQYMSEGEDNEGNPMGYYKFTLNDTTPNWIVKDEYTGTIKIGDNEYKAGETIGYTDKESLTAAQKENCNQLPSMYDAFLEFCALTAYPETKVGTRGIDGVDVYGKHVSMGQTSIGTQSAYVRFAAGQIGMFVGLRSVVTPLRTKINDKNTWIKDQDSWDVAPLPMYKTYYEEGDTLPAGKKVGDVKVHGKQGGHSGSMGLAISYKSKKKEAAWEFIKYVAGTEGQTKQAEAGFAIPNQKTLANSDVFLQKNMAPKNSQVFVDAAAYEQPADWWYLTNWKWIDGWADALNNHVREPDSKNPMTVEDLFKNYGESTQLELYKYTYNSHNLSAKPKK